MEGYELTAYRFRELKYFCLQYKDMRAELRRLEEGSKALEGKDSTAYLAIRQNEYRKAIELIETTAKDTNLSCWRQILDLVVNDKPTGAIANISTRNKMEELRRKFYWLLDKRKGI